MQRFGDAQHTRRAFRKSSSPNVPSGHRAPCGAAALVKTVVDVSIADRRGGDARGPSALAAGHRHPRHQLRGHLPAGREPRWRSAVGAALFTKNRSRLCRLLDADRNQAGNSERPNWPRVGSAQQNQDSVRRGGRGWRRSGDLRVDRAAVVVAIPNVSSTWVRTRSNVASASSPRSTDSSTSDARVS